MAKRIARLDLPGTTSGLPMTYMHEGKQYVVFSVSTEEDGAELVALALPN